MSDSPAPSSMPEDPLEGAVPPPAEPPTPHPAWVEALGSDLDAAVERLRLLLPVTRSLAYMNTGSSGPCPLPALETVCEFHRWFNEVGPGGLTAVGAASAVERQLRQDLAALLNAAPEEFALMPGTSQGINVVFQGLDWGPDDLILTADLEHDGILLPAYLVQSRYGARLSMLHLLEGQDPLEALATALDERRPKLFAISHVAFCTGQLLPVKEMIDLCHEREIPVLVDAAQSVGQIPVDLRALNAEFTAFPAFKWLLAPDGAGALHVRADWIERLKLSAVGWGSRASFDLEGHMSPHPSAARFEIGTKEWAVLRGWTECLRLHRHFGMEAIASRIVSAARRLHARLADIPGVSMVLPPAQVQTGLLSFRVEGLSARETILRLLKDFGVLGRWIPNPFPDWSRLSVNFFQTEEELDRVVEAVWSLAREAGARG